VSLEPWHRRLSHQPNHRTASQDEGPAIKYEPINAEEAINIFNIFIRYAIKLLFFYGHSKNEEKKMTTII